MHGADHFSSFKFVEKIRGYTSPGGENRLRRRGA